MGNKQKVLERMKNVFNNLCKRITQKKYDYIIPLGYNCTLAYQINRIHKYLESYLFNWVYITDYEKFIECLSNDNADIFSQGYEYYELYNMFKSLKYELVFYGKSNVEQLKTSDGYIMEDIIKNEFKDLCERNLHLNEKFEELKSNNCKKLFVHIINPNVEINEANNFINQLYKYIKGNYTNSDLLIIQEMSKNTPQLIQKEGLFYEFVKYLPPEDEAVNENKTDNKSFDKIFKKYVLKSKNNKSKNKIHKFEKRKIMKHPKISVVMSAYNRPEYVKDAIESILNQTYKDFEFIIIDDCSTDNTVDVIQKYADSDERIIFIRNPKNMDYNYNLRKGFEIAKGEYIARMDDDDISEPTRFEKQVKYLDEHPEITVLGTFIKTFGNPDAKSWISIVDPDELDVAMNFYNPMCHPSVMIRKDFLRKYNLTYSPKELYAEEYHLWKQIILHGGKLANLPEELVNYRCHKKSITQASKTSIIQDKTAERVREDLLNRFYNDKNQVKRIRKSIFKYPFDSNNKKKISDVLEQMKKCPDIISKIGVEKFERHFCGEPSDMHIFFASDNNFAQHLCVAMASILKNALPFETLNFYILDGGISEKNKNKIETLKYIKDFNIEFIKIDDSLFECCPITPECQHISKQTYYRYIIPKLKPELDKAFYFDCDIVVEDSLNEFWNIDLDDNYVAAVEELWDEAHEHYVQNHINKSFNAGIILINISQWKNVDITNRLFENTKKLVNENKIRWVDQCVLNFTFNNHVKFVLPIYNLQQTAYFRGQYSLYTDNDMAVAKAHPVIIHYSGILKPWHKKCEHPLWKRYYHYLKFTPYKNKYYAFKIKRALRNLADLVYREKRNGDITKHKLFGITLFKADKRNFYCKKTFLGITFYKRFMQKQFLHFISDQLNNITNEYKNANKKIYNEINIIKANQDWQNYALSRLHYGQNAIFRYNTGLQLYLKNLSYERVIAFDINDAPPDHSQRYKFAANLINSNDDVLDIACGTGYGTSALCKSANSALGIDIDKPSINFANKIFANDKLKYLCADIFNTEINQTFDKIISFETIEHIENDVLFIQNLYSMLRDNGELICSVPNETIFPFVREENPFHIRHYTVESLTNLLTNNGFEIEEIYFQYHELDEQIVKQQGDKQGYTIVCRARKVLNE